MKNYTALKIILFAVFFIQPLVFAVSSDCPQNIILIIVDGGGFTHIDAIDYYQYGKKGEQNFEKFPVKLAVTTFPLGGFYDPNKAAQDFNYVRTGFTDSAAAATALATGVKTSNGSIGVDVNSHRLQNIIEKCEKLGMATGIVTTVEITDATPAGFVSHAKSRRDYEQIADEMINKSALEVIFGCGNPFFDDDGKKLDEPSSFKYVGSKKIWNSLVKGTAGADADGDKVADKWTLIQSKQEFISLADGNTPKRVLGIAQVAATLQEKRTCGELSRTSGNSVVPFDVPFNQNVPNLSEMTKAALNVLDRDSDGFFIMIEAGAVDWASHDNNGARMIEEMRDFTGAADAVIDWVQTKSSWQKTLVIITSDHQTGYPTDIVNGGRGTLPQMQWNSKNHTNSLVFLFAKGQGSELFGQQVKDRDSFCGSFIDNTDIAKVIFTLLERRVSTKK